MKRQEHNEEGEYPWNDEKQEDEDEIEQDE